MKRLFFGLALCTLLLVNLAPAFAREAGHQPAVTKYHRPSPDGRPTGVGSGP